TELDPGNAAMWAGKGSALLYLGRQGEALAALDRATELQADFATSWFCKGIALDDLGRFAEALEAYQQATELDPKKAAAWFKKGGCRLKLGDDTGSIADLRKALTLDPSFRLAAELLAWVLARGGKWDEAWAVLAGPFHQPSPKPSPLQDKS